MERACHFSGGDSTIVVMKIKKSLEGEREAERFVAQWPTRLTEAGALKVRPVFQPDFRKGEGQRSWENRISEALSNVQAGEILLVGLPDEPVRIPVIKEIVRMWDAERSRAPGQQVAWAIGFDEHNYPLEDLQFLWDRANLGLRGRAMALILLRHVTAFRRTLACWVPLRGETARLASFLPGLPVVSAEILKGLTHPSVTVSAHRWSNRLAAMRRAGLLVPLKALGAQGTAERSAHAEALGRELDRRPTRLYRSVMHDLREWAEERRASAEADFGGIVGI